MEGGLLVQLFKRGFRFAIDSHEEKSELLSRLM
jgi:hypothetical protein